MSSTIRTMKPIAWVLFVALVVTTCASAIPKPNEHKTSNDRVHEQDLSKKEHFEDEEHENHNPDYDHEAFLGEEDAREFDQLTPDESKEKLAIIFTKIDKDKDGSVTEEELRDWIKHVQNKYITTDTNRQWEEHEVKDDKIEWDTYKKRTYGFLDACPEDNEIYRRFVTAVMNVPYESLWRHKEQDDDEEDEDGYSYKEMVKRDLRRWEKADGDGDKKLTKEEFSHFLHPEEVEHMRDIVIDETLEDIDKDKDGYISLEEYIAARISARLRYMKRVMGPEIALGDMWPNQDENEEPDWVKTERDQFHSFRDKNKDGRMDREEVMDWIIPADYDHSEAESKHLVWESDQDRDGKLSKEEVISKYDLFVGSQATDFGEALTRHDEF